MASDARLVHERGNIRQVAGTALESGQIVQLPDGRAAYVEGLNAVPAGGEYSARYDGIVRVPKASGLDLAAAGVQVDWDATNRTVVTTGGDYALGLLIAPAGTGTTEAWVELNEPIPANPGA